MMVVNNNGIYGGLDNDLYYEITNEAEQPSSITRQEIDQWFFEANKLGHRLLSIPPNKIYFKFLGLLTI